MLDIYEQEARLREQYSKLDIDELRKKAEEMGLGKPRLEKYALTEYIIDVETGRIDLSNPLWQLRVRGLFGAKAFEKDEKSEFDGDIPNSEKEESLRFKRRFVLDGRSNSCELHYVLTKLKEIENSVGDLYNYISQKGLI